MIPGLSAIVCGVFLSPRSASKLLPGKMGRDFKRHCECPTIPKAACCCLWSAASPAVSLDTSAKPDR